MIRLSFTLLISLFVLVSFSQTKTNKDNVNGNEPLIKVTLLGTGTPLPVMERFGASILVEAGGKTLLFDAGRGCLQRLRQVNVFYNQIDALFLTHLHSDHIVGIPDLWLSGWLTSERTTPLEVFGPAGTGALITNLQKAFAYDIKIRTEDDKVSEAGSRLLVKEIKQGPVFEKNGVRVIAFLVDHYPIAPAFGYRIEYKGHFVVLSGDTRYSENLIRYAKGADLLIHEVAIAPDTLGKTDPKYHILAHHTTPEQAATIFNQVRPKLAAYSHIVNIYAQKEEDIGKRTKAIYTGPLILGKDLMSFSITDSVSVNPWQKE
jgi:ribonuclease Z